MPKAPPMQPTICILSITRILKFDKRIGKIALPPRDRNITANNGTVTFAFVGNITSTTAGFETTYMKNASTGSAASHSLIT